MKAADRLAFYERIQELEDEVKELLDEELSDAKIIGKQDSLIVRLKLACRYYRDNVLMTDEFVDGLELLNGD